MLYVLYIGTHLNILI